ncbi:MAG TPA: hypothetical protein DCP92_13865 [Nitrospiraceae bacterium]|jgi:hypothetical protein|nr:hypothetical protein [Nitrospiraceae bacterium]
MGQDVAIYCFARPGDLVETPLGSGLIPENEHNYLVDIDACKGSVVGGSMVGPIVYVNGQVITVDYGNTFGGKGFICRVAVQKSKKLEWLRSVAGGSDR